MKCDLCGEPVEARATLGGVVIVDTESDPSGDYALVAGHLRRIFPDWQRAGDGTGKEHESKVAKNGYIRFASNASKCAKMLRPRPIETRTTKPLKGSKR